MVKNDQKKLTVLQIIPKLNSGGVERGTLEVGKYLSKKGHFCCFFSENRPFFNFL